MVPSRGRAAASGTAIAARRSALTEVGGTRGRLFLMLQLRLTALIPGSPRCGEGGRRFWSRAQSDARAVTTRKVLNTIHL